MANAPTPRVRRVGAVAALAVGVMLLGLALPAAAKSHATTVVRAALPPGKINHIIVIEFENEGYQTTFGPGSVATYLNGTLRAEGELLPNYYAIGHNSLDNYIAQVSGQSPTEDTQADCADNGFAYASVEPGTPDPNQAVNPGQVDGEGCVYPSSVQTIANQLDAKYPPNPKTHVASWRGYDQDMGNTPSHDGGVADPTGGTDCAHPAMGATDTAEFATSADQYTTRHNPFVWFHSIIDNVAECDANVVPLGTLGPSGQPLPSGHLAVDLSREKTTPRFAFITPNLCSDGHDGHLRRNQQHRRACGRADRGGPVPPGLDAPHPRLPCLQARRHLGRHHVRRGRRRPVRSLVRRLVLQRGHRPQHPRARKCRVGHRHRPGWGPDRGAAPQFQVHRSWLH